MSVSYTLSDIRADFGSGAKHVANSASPFLEFEFGMPPRVFKSTMVKHGGPMVAWQQPVLLTGAAASRLIVTAKSHKSMLPDTTIGSGTIDLAQSAGTSGVTVVPLSGKTGKSAGTVQFVVTQGQGAGAGNISQPQPNNNGVVEGVGGPGRNIEGGLGNNGMGTGMGHHGGPGVGTGAALGTAAGAGAAGLAHHHNQGGQGMVNQGQPGYGNNGGVQGGIVPGGAAGGYNNNQLAPGQQGGMMGQQQQGMVGQQGGMVGQQGGMGGGMGGAGGAGMGGAPTEFSEKHTHSLHDHDENESYETRRVG